jgi:hypothetical protein
VLHGREMRLTGIVHVKARLLDNVCDVRPGEGEVLESFGQAAVGSRVALTGPHVGGDLSLCVDRRGIWLAVAHASALKDISSVLVLVKRPSDRCSIETSRKWWRVDVLHCELLLESCSGALKKLRARSVENNVVDVEQLVSSVGTVAVGEQ